MIRVCHLGKYYPPASGGIETHLQTLARAQVELGLDVEVLCVQHRPGPTVSELDGSIRVTRFEPLVRAGKLEISPALVRAIRSARADVLHMQVPNPTMIVAVALARPRVPLVVTYQSDVVRQRVRSLLFRPLERWVYRRVHRVLPTSPPYAAGSRFLREYRDRTTVVPMGLDLEPYRCPSDQDVKEADALRAKHAGPIWLACGRLIYYKGLENAIQALPQVPGTLLIVGDGPERPRLESEARRVGVAERVHFVGDLPCRRIVPYYLAATAFWFPSNAKSEAFGLVQVEAMAAGCPVINTDIAGSGVAWVSRDGESGITVPVNDPAALAAAANRLVADPALRESLAQGGRDRATHDFDHRVMAERSVEVYEEVLGPIPAEAKR